MTYPRVPGYTAEEVRDWYDAGLPLPMPPRRPSPTTPVNGQIRWASVRDLLLVLAGIVIAVTGYVLVVVPLLVLGLAVSGGALLMGTPALRPDSRVGERQHGCMCRGCQRPGQRYLWERLLRRPLHTVPRSHAEAMIGIEHGRLHDLRRKEAEAGMPHSAEVITHFALPESHWTEDPDDVDGFTVFDFPGGCWDDPALISLSLR